MINTIACIATGPSLTRDQVDTARRKGFRLFVCNNAWQLAPDAELLYACNYEWWRHYHPDVARLPGEKWTTNRQAADEFGLNWIAEVNRPGLSASPEFIHHGHGSGYSLVSMAHRAGAERVVLLGYDMKYAADYDGKAHKAGHTPRHYFGEYPAKMQHWPSFSVVAGVHVELVALYQSIRDQGAVEIVNCTPDSAVDCFERVDINAI